MLKTLFREVRQYKKAESLGFAFTDLKDWLYPLLDYYIDVAHEGMLGLYDSLD